MFLFVFVSGMCVCLCVYGLHNKSARVRLLGTHISN